MTRQILNFVFGNTLQRHTSRYLDEITHAPVRASREQTSNLLKTLSAREPTITLGVTGWGQTVAVPLDEILTSHGVITGGTGSGKTRAALLIVKAVLDQVPQTPNLGIGVVDPKGELFLGALVLLAQRLGALERSNSEAAVALRRRVVVIDFSSGDPLSPYNVLFQSHNIDSNYFAETRADQITDLLPAQDSLSLSGHALLRRAIMLLGESGLPISRLPEVLCDSVLLGKLVTRSNNEVVKEYFTRQLVNVPKQTVAALSRRVEALLSSQAVRLALNARTAPDFRALQDDGRIVFINCFGENLSGSVRQFLEALVIGDLTRSTFARKRPATSFLWMIDEAQTCFATARLRDQMMDAFAKARSFGSHFLCLTQNIASAVHDQRALGDVYTNVKWTLSLRGQPADCAFLKAALPVTGRKLRPQTDPLTAPDFYSLGEERTIEHDGIANLPDRTGFLWLKSRSPEAVKLTTATLELPQGEDVDRLVRPLLSDANFGDRISRSDYEAEIAGRRQAESPVDFGVDLAGAYKRVRGEES